MRRDSIFYQLFRRSPALLFALLNDPPVNASRYQFDSVAVKEPTFAIDGVFLPPDSDAPGVVYFCEVQFQRDDCLYERLFGEAFLYFYRNRDRFSDWRAVVIYPSQQIEQRDIRPYQALLQSHQVYRIYLDQLGAIDQLPVGIALMVLTTLSDAETPAAARSLLTRTPDPTALSHDAIMELVTTIMVYKFIHLSRQEVEQMLGITLQETRVYQEAKEEGRQEGRQAGLLEGEQIGRQVGEQIGRQAGERSLVLRQLSRRLGGLPEELQGKIASLAIAQLENLAEALLDFTSLTDLATWLTTEQEEP